VDALRVLPSGIGDAPSLPVLPGEQGRKVTQAFNAVVND
jgi:hypothetical protein